MFQTPKVSIIVPVYNAEKYLHRCIDSIVNQTLKDIEIILVDDGSTDRSFQICQEYASRDYRIHLLQQENRGPSEARENGLQHATGEYIWFIDSDDYCNLSACEEIYNRAHKQNLDILFFGTKLHNGNPSTGTIKYYLLSAWKSTNFYNVLSLSTHYPVLFQLPRELWDKAFKRDFLLKNKLHFHANMHLYDDILFCVRALFLSQRIGLMDKNLYHYHLNHTSSIMDLSNQYTEDIFIYLKIMERFLTEHSYPQEIVDAWALREFKSNNFWLTRVDPKHSFKKKLRAFYKHLNPRIYSKRVRNSSLIQDVQRHPLKKLRHSIQKRYHQVKHFIWEHDSKDFPQPNWMLKRTTFYRLCKIPIFQHSVWIPNLRSFQNSLVLGVQRSINTAFLHQKTFAPFRNKYKGKDLVLVGAGPTLPYYIPHIQGPHIGCNRAFLAEFIHFDYLFAADKIGIEMFYKQFLSYRDGKCIKFLGDMNCGANFQLPEHIIQHPGVRRYKTSNGCTGFILTPDIDMHPLGAFHSISLQAMQFALFTQPKRIYLVGIDCANAGKHFAGPEHDVSSRGENIQFLQSVQIAEWKQLKDFAAVYYPATEIISINPIGLKNVFHDVYTSNYLADYPALRTETTEILQ